PYQYPGRRSRKGPGDAHSDTTSDTAPLFPTKYVPQNSTGTPTGGAICPTLYAGRPGDAPLSPSSTPPSRCDFHRPHEVALGALVCIACGVLVVRPLRNAPRPRSSASQRRRGGRGKREPGANPGLPRSGKRERPPSPVRADRVKHWTRRPGSDGAEESPARAGTRPRVRRPAIG